VRPYFDESSVNAVSRMRDHRRGRHLANDDYSVRGNAELIQSKS
jgi:hypothetical protein